VKEETVVTTTLQPPIASDPRAQAVAEALTQLGNQADPKRVAEAVKAQTGLDIEPGEVAAIRDELLQRAATPPEPDQPPPEAARRTEGDRADGPDAELHSV
jgi:hypothetical protein